MLDEKNSVHHTLHAIKDYDIPLSLQGRYTHSDTLPNKTIYRPAHCIKCRSSIAIRRICITKIYIFR